MIYGRVGELVIWLHAPTLTVVLTAVTFGVGLLLLISWLQNREVWSLLWWSCANISGGAAVTLFGLRDIIADYLSINLAAALLCFAFTATWTGFRLFCGKAAPPAFICAPSLISLCLYEWPPFYASITWRVAVASIFPAAISLACAWELWRLKSERLVSRYPMIGWLCLHALVFGARAPLTLLLLTSPSKALVYSPWFSVIMCEALLNVIATSFLQVSMIKDRAEHRQRQAALTDPLTGAPNRRALFGEAEKALARAAEQRRPLCALILDVDRFKSINDRFGHGGGDIALCRIAQTMKAHLRENDLFGRIGGEEFVCILPDTALAGAMAVAEGLRARIGATKLVVGDAELRISVSIGVAMTEDGSGALEALLRAADRSLYEAKTAGRDRVVAGVSRLSEVKLRVA
ncbi:GGDEF domain-containing protein [Terrarubrum flagellatum]|uniref:GGDEF domain-containing protein n=1 Tax=Terrirubrum flagellatum TaxID=2895980 RepID=UPI0031454BD4